MSEILTQSEIDQLLTALSSGELDTEELQGKNEPTVRSYDFKRALRLSKEHIRTLTRIHETYARHLSSYLSGGLRTFVDIKLNLVDQLPYEEFIRSIPEQSVLFLFQAPPLEGRMMLEIPPEIAHVMLDRTLGGKGRGTFQGSFTEIDAILLEKLLSYALPSFREAWKVVVPVNPQVDSIEYNAQFLQLVSANDTVAAISFSVELGEVTGIINLCIPHIAIEPFIRRLSTQYLYAHQTSTKKEKDSMPLCLHLLNTKVMLSVELGRTTLTMRELMDLERGDVVPLEQSIHRPLSVRVGKEEKFRALPGTVNQHMGIQIVEILPSGGEAGEQ